MQTSSRITLMKWFASCLYSNWKQTKHQTKQLRQCVYISHVIDVCTYSSAIDGIKRAALAVGLPAWGMCRITPRITQSLSITSPQTHNTTQIWTKMCKQCTDVSAHNQSRVQLRVQIALLCDLFSSRSSPLVTGLFAAPCPSTSIFQSIWGLHHSSLFFLGLTY